MFHWRHQLFSCPSFSSNYFLPAVVLMVSSSICSMHRLVHLRAGDDDDGVPAVAGIRDQSECNPDVLFRTISGHRHDRCIRFTGRFW